MPEDTAIELAQRVEALEAENKQLREALIRVLRAFEADAQQAPNLDVLTCWQTNSQAIESARCALLSQGKPGE